MLNFLNLLNERDFVSNWGNYVLSNRPVIKTVKRTTIVSVVDSWTIYRGEELITEDYNLAQFKRIVAPLVRLIYPQLMANELIDAQPLAGPAGLNYYLRHI